MDLGSYNSWDEFIKKHKTGAAGDSALVAGKKYYWDKQSKTWLQDLTYKPNSNPSGNASGYTPITEGGVAGYSGNGFVSQNAVKPRSASLDFMVYTGNTVPESLQNVGSGEPAEPAGQVRNRALVPEKQNASDYFQTWFEKKPDEIKSLQNRLVSMNVLGNNFTPGRFDGATQAALASQLQLMSQYQNPEYNLKNWFTGFSGGGGGNSTTTTIQPHLYSSDTLKETINAVYRSAIGRDATTAEINKAIKMVNAAEKKTPTKTVTKTTGSGSGNVKVVSTSSGGVNPQQLITDQAKANPEFANYQAATTYFDAMLETLNGPVGRGA